MRSKSMFRNYIATVIIATLSLGAGNAWAQSTGSVAPAKAGDADQSDGKLNVITVTARRTSENQQKVPVAITTFSKDDIVKRSIVNLTDIGSTTSNMNTVQAIGTKYGAAVDIRGQIQRQNVITTDQSVGIYFDDIYYARPFAILADLTDIQSVQVLKGPQGTLYGRNTTGGAIKITSVPADPSGGVTGFVTTGYGNYNSFTISGAINVPIITDKLAIRYAGSHREHDGYTHSLLVPTKSPGGVASSLTPFRDIDTDNEDSYSHRLSIKATPSDAVTFDLVFSLFTAHDNGTFAVTPYGDIQNYTGSGSSSVYSSSPQHRADFYTALTDSIPGDSVNVKTVSGSLNWKLSDNLTAKLIAGYVTQKAYSAQNADGTVSDTVAYLSIATIVAQFQHQHSEEFQLQGKAFDDRLKFIGGLYYFDEFGGDNSYGQETFFKGINITAVTDETGHNQSLSGFSNAIFSVTDKLHLNGGLRYTKDIKQSTSHPRTAAVSGYPGICILNPAETPGAITSTVNGGPCSISLSKSYKYLTYEAGLDYQFTPAIFAYAKVNNGQRSGGLQSRLVAGEPLLPYDPETVTNFEAGVKTELLDRHLRLNLDGFHSRYKKVQLSVSLLLPGGLTNVVQNFGNADINGLEFESALGLGPLTLSGSAGYIHTKYDGNVIAVYVPKWTANVSADFVQPVSFGKVNARLDYSYVGARSSVNFTGTPDANLAAYTLLNGRAGITLPDGLSISAFAKNIAAKKYFTNLLITGYSAAFFGVRGATVGAPRTFGVEATFAF